MPISTPRLAIHYGHHEGTTGAHFAEAAVRLGLGTSHPASPGEHYSVRRFGAEAYFWVESGIISYPLDTFRSKGPTAGYLIDVHLHMDRSLLQANLFDVVFVAQRDLIPVVQEVHPQVHWLPLAAPSHFLDLPRKRIYDASFVGNLHSWTTRAQILRAVGNRVKTNNYWRRHSVEEMGLVYASSRVVVNPAVANDLNMRFFEGLACGALIVTPDVGNGQDEIAVRGREFFVCDFTDPEIVANEVVRLITSGVDGSQGREIIAAGHTYEHRIKTVLNIMANSELAAPVRGFSGRERVDLLCKLAVSHKELSLANSALQQVRGLRDLSHYNTSALSRIALWKLADAGMRRIGPKFTSSLRRMRTR